MHLIFENVAPSLFRWWTGEFLEDGGEEAEVIALGRESWLDIGRDMENSRKTIPTAYGRAVRDIYNHHSSFKAEEWSGWLLYYSPILLRGRLRAELYEHYMKLVTAIEMAIDYEVTDQEINTIKRLLAEFVADYERLYYRHEMHRISACLSTYHFLLHLADSITNCGPTWVYWQFPCERLCGMLKTKVKSRVSANRNLSLGILHEEQLNHLQFACQLNDDALTRSISDARFQYTAKVDNHEYSFLHPQKCDHVRSLEVSHLALFYATLFGCTRKDITHNANFTHEIIKWACCRLADDRDVVSSEWYESRRSMVPAYRQSSAIRYSLYANDQLVTYYGRVIYFFLQTFRQSTRMLAYVQRYKATDHSLNMADVCAGKIVELDGEGRKEVVCVTALDAGIGVMTSAGAQYFINRSPILQS